VPIPGGGRPRWLVPLLAVLAVLVLAGGAYAALQALTGGDRGGASTQATSPTANPRGTEPRPQPQARPPAEVQVAVLNGTQQSGLAARVAGELSAYPQPATGTFNQQPRQASTVYYLPGARADAQAVAQRLEISAVRPIDQATRAAVAGQAPAPQVVVVLGADQADRAAASP
jgi:hypothetical protein